MELNFDQCVFRNRERTLNAKSIWQGSVCQINSLLFLDPLNHENGTCLDKERRCLE